MIGSTLKITSMDQFTSVNVNANHHGVCGVATAGTTTNLDYKLLDDCFISGAIFLVNGGTWGDSATLQVVDVDNVLGYGAGTVLGQYVSNWFVASDRQQQFDEDSKYPAKVIAGLYLRVVYNSTGASDVPFAVNYKLNKALY